MVHLHVDSHYFFFYFLFFVAADVMSNPVESCLCISTPFYVGYRLCNTEPEDESKRKIEKRVRGAPTRRFTLLLLLFPILPLLPLLPSILCCRYYGYVKLRRKFMYKYSLLCGYRLCNTEP